MISVFVRDIKHSIETKSYFAALSLALTLPDICGNAEFPDRQVAERYIEWYNKYIGDDTHELSKDNPWLSGEIIYNLRNTFLHLGSPTISGGKVKEEANQLDRFVLVLGDGTLLHSVSMKITAGTQETGKITYKMIAVDIAYLCGIICDTALQYYENNRGKFDFNFQFVEQEELAAGESSSVSLYDLCAKLLSQKSEKKYGTKRSAEKASQAAPVSKKNSDNQNIQKGKKTPKNDSENKREAQLRSFFGRHFKKKIFLEKKEEIIQAALKSKTKQQVNNALMKHFEGKDVSEIYKRLEPFIKNLPGK